MSSACIGVNVKDTLSVSLTAANELTEAKFSDELQTFVEVQKAQTKWEQQQSAGSILGVKEEV